MVLIVVVSFQTFSRSSAGRFRLTRFTTIQARCDETDVPISQRLHASLAFSPVDFVYRSSRHAATHQTIEVCLKCKAASRGDFHLGPNTSFSFGLSTLDKRCLSRALQTAHSDSGPKDRAFRRHLQLHCATIRLGARPRAQVIEYLLATGQEPGVLLGHGAVASD